MSDEEKHKPVVDKPLKSSMEILSELFSTFDAKPPVIIKKEKGLEGSKKHKKSKKKHKHKDKKHKKKDKKKKSKGTGSDSDESDIDLAQLLIKQEKETCEKKIKIAGTDVEFNLTSIKAENNTNEGVGDEDEKNGKKKVNTLKLISTLNSNTKTIKTTEDGEIVSTESDAESNNKKDKKHKKRKHKSDHDKPKKIRRSESKDHKHKDKKKTKDNDFYKHEDLDEKINKSKEVSKKAIRSRDRSRSKDKELHGDRERSRDRHREKDYDRDRYKDDNSRDNYTDRHRKYRENPYYNDFYRREKDYSKEDDKWFMRDRYRGYNDRDRDRRYRSRSPQRDSSYIDKKKLLEIARKNAIQMMKSGSLPGALTLGPQAQEKVIAAIKAGGKTVEELTDFCKTLSKKEELGELSSCSDDNGNSDSDTDKPFHHPFQIKDRPTSITMNIKNSVPLPIKSTQERSTELRMQFPVSSGQQHRKTEEWVPVSTKSESTKTTTTTISTAPVTPAIPLPIEPAPTLPIETPPISPKETLTVPAPPNGPPGPQVFPTPTLEPSFDIGSIVSQRLTAMRKLQENPHDVQALTQIYKSNKEMQTWAESKQQPGQFTGSTGAQILSQAELSSGYQAWAKKDQLQCAAPVSGGMGMHLLQKMGWKPGEGLGKEKTGTLEPLLLEVKLDKKGLVANEEQGKRNRKQKQTNNVPTVKTLAGKHPVSLLGEYASKRKLGAPQYNLCFECGPDHKKNFLFKVLLNNTEYKPNVASPNKKEAKALAATICLQQLGLLP